MERKYKSVLIRVEKGDITKQHVDAIVNPANSMMVMGGGVAGAIKKEGGELIEREALKKSPVPVGRAVATTAGRLKAKYVIHSPTMEKPAMRTDVDKVRKATIAALEKAIELKIESIAFPGMGTGVGGVSYTDAAKAMVDSIKQIADRGHKITVVLVAYSDELKSAFESALDLLS